MKMWREGIHPAHLTSPKVLSCAELVYWFRELLENHALGWAGHPAALARALDVMGVKPSASLKAKARRVNPAWIYPSEQCRYSRSVKQVLAGEIICRKVGTYWQAVIAYHPVPLSVRPLWRYDLARGRLERRAVPLSYANPLPSFAGLFAGAKTWGMDIR